MQKDKNSIKKSVIDYIIITEEHQDLITSMTIDEEREDTPYRDDTKYGERVYTDHNMITIEINLEMKMQPKEQRIVINGRNMDKFHKATETGKLKEIWEEQSDIKGRYTKWNNAVIKIAKEICTDKKGTNRSKRDKDNMKQKETTKTKRQRKEKKN